MRGGQRGRTIGITANACALLWSLTAVQCSDRLMRVWHATVVTPGTKVVAVEGDHEAKGTQGERGVSVSGGDSVAALTEGVT